MRGKLRDKRAESKRDIFKREVMQRRRTTKRNNRTMLRLNQQLEEDYLSDVEDAQETLVEVAKK